MSQPPRTAIAQTNLQLFDQLHDLGYSEADLLVVDAAYRLAIQLFPAHYRGSAKPFLCHLVGTASVLAGLRLPVAIVATGLLHSAYSLGDFGSVWLGVSPSKRQALRERVGSEIEERVERYAALAWQDDAPSVLLDRLSRGETIDRETILVRLANEVDDHDDLGILYCSGAAERVQRASRIADDCVKLAQQLGYPDLAASLLECLTKCCTATIVHGLRQGQNLTFVVPSPSRLRWRLGRLLERLHLRPRLL